MHSATKPRILLVDDEPETVLVLRLFLRSLGYAVAAAGNAADGLRLLRGEAHFSLVLTDYFMPVMDGGRFLAAIREEWADLPVVMMTAYGRKEELFTGLHHFCHGFIEKPFAIDELIAEIERVLRDR